MSVILSTHNLTKKYLFNSVLSDVSIDVAQGKIFGLLGPNGSGKTTFMKILMGLVQASSGSFTVCGKPAGIETRNLVSFLPDKNTLFPWMSAEDAIRFYADFFDDFDTVKAFDMLKFMNLEKTQKVKTMSKGMKEKLNLTLTFSRQARLFILDEPLAGTDPVARERIISTIISTWSEDAAIVITTHLVSDIEHIFNEVAFLHKGKIILTADADTIREEQGKSVYQLYIDTFKDMED